MYELKRKVDIINQKRKILQEEEETEDIFSTISEKDLTKDDLSQIFTVLNKQKEGLEALIEGVNGNTN